jgi:TolB-like protein/cytochrome c-type biogenesis protein CcmH/NrfG
MPAGNNERPAADSVTAPGEGAQGGPDTALAFISYASADGSVAETVCSGLERAGLRCWIAPRDVTPGELYATSIVHAIDSTRVLVLILSQHAADSAHVFREVERASSKRHAILSFRIDTSPLPEGLEYFLNTSQWLDASSTQVDRALPRLVEAVRHALGAPALPARVGHGSTVTARKSPPSKRLLVALAVLVATAIAYVAVDRFWPSRPADSQMSPDGTAALPPADALRAAAAPPKSIAVLPFADLSEKKDQEYFSDGLSEELIDHLARVPDLKVIARSSAFAFKGTNEDVRTIAGKLGVSNLLQGSVRKAGNRLRITAQLIRASDGVLLWSETFDRKLIDVFELQDEISARVAKALDTTLNLASVTGVDPASKHAVDIEAYNLVLQGNYLYWRGNKGDEAKAVELFEQAVRRDPQYALAWAKLARALVYQGFIGDLAADEAISRGRRAVERALAIDPNSAEAYYARGNLFRMLSGDWSAAFSDYRKAAELDPHGEVGRDAVGNRVLLEGELSGQMGARIDVLSRELESNPLDTDVLSDLAWAHLNAGDLDASAATFLSVLEINPDFSIARAAYGMALLLNGKKIEALAAAQKEPDEASRLWALSAIHWASGQRAESDAALGALERKYADRKAYEIASAHAYRGDAGTAFSWLDRAYQQRAGPLSALKVDPLFNKLHRDPRFSAMLRKAKLAE